MKNLERKALFFFLGLFFGLLFTPTAYAEVRLGLTPAKVELSLAGGEGGSGEITVVNEGSEPLEVSFYVRDYYFADDGKIVFAEGQEKRWSASKWLEVGQVSGRISPGASIRLPYRVRVPLGAEPGSHWAVIFAEGRAIGNNTRTSPLGVRVGAVVLITVPGDVIAKGEILDFRVPAVGYKKVPVTFKFRNSGNVHINLRPQLEVFHKGQVINRTQLDEVVSYPQTVREVKGYLQLGNIWGLHEAVLKIEQEGGTMVYRAPFLLLPWPWILGGLLLLAYLLAWLIIRRRRKQASPRLDEYPAPGELAVGREAAAVRQALGISAALPLPAQRPSSRSSRADFTKTLNILTETVEQLRQENALLRRNLEDLSSQASSERWEKVVAESLIDAQTEIENVRAKAAASIERANREAHKQMAEIENRFREKFKVLLNDYKATLSDVERFLGRLGSAGGAVDEGGDS
ncbi:MAG: hypothetical protein D9V47_10115 [Clostridia bacterium]|nr:MAG: hypothetical protein D9V47_10115 [Clostridia bacterium]